MRFQNPKLVYTIVIMTVILIPILDYLKLLPIILHKKSSYQTIDYNANPQAQYDCYDGYKPTFQKKESNAGTVKCKSDDKELYFRCLTGQTISEPTFTSSGEENRWGQNSIWTTHLSCKRN